MTFHRDGRVSINAALCNDFFVATRRPVVVDLPVESESPRVGAAVSGREQRSWTQKENRGKWKVVGKWRKVVEAGRSLAALQEDLLFGVADLGRIYGDTAAGRCLFHTEIRWKCSNELLGGEYQLKSPPSVFTSSWLGSPKCLVRHRFFPGPSP